MIRKPLREAREFLRTLVAARSYRSAVCLHTTRVAKEAVRLPGFAAPLRLRTGTHDAKLLRGLLLGGIPAEYEVPTDFPTPRVILDIGANIGAVTAAFARRWPEARIYAFEPLPENVEILRQNAAQFPGVQVLPYGLGAQSALATYVRSDDGRNFGGGGFYGGRKGPPEQYLTLPVRGVAEALAELGIDEVDLIKIDTEGAEADILLNIPPALLARTRAIVGELHRKPRDAELLQYLSERFEVERTLRQGRVVWFRALARAAAHVCPGVRVAEHALRGAGDPSSAGAPNC
jgi:FkbM family methyltransferase